MGPHLYLVSPCFQGFLMEVIDAQSHYGVSNTTNSREPSFSVTGLRPGTGYIVSVLSFNSKGIK